MEQESVERVCRWRNRQGEKERRRQEERKGNFEKCTKGKRDGMKGDREKETYRKIGI
jgi:hypothetical protein